MARVHFLGTGAALPTADRANTALYLEGDGEGGLLIDCGGDVYRALLRAGIGHDAARDLFVTHAHIDHVGGLPSLLESFRLGGRSAPLRIVALPEVMAVVRALVAAFDFELTLDRWTFDVTFETVEHGTQIALAGMPASIHRMDHSVPSAGVRIETSGGVFAYTCDTQPNPNIPALGQGAALFITECTFLHRSEQYARISKHTTALEAGQQAALCGAQALALVHLGTAEGWTAEEARAEAAQGFAGRIVVPNDGDTLGWNAATFPASDGER